MSNSIPEHVRKVLIQHVGRSETGIAVIDADDRFLYCNRTFIAMFGLEEFLPIGRTHDEFLSWMYHHRIGNGKGNATLGEWMAQIHTLYRAHTYHSSEVELNNGRWVLVAQQLHRNGHIVSVCTDITRSKETELALLVAYSELERLAMTDELTEVANRRHFLARLESERMRALRYAHRTSLVMLDLDHFKQVNDRFGHPAGDEVLRHFARLLRSHIRSEDFVGRLGGEEFAVLIPETGHSGAHALMERIRHELALVTLDSVAPGFGYTFSAGIAELRLTESAGCKEWIHEADQALYRAKTSGRNRTMVYQAE